MIPITIHNPLISISANFHTIPRTARRINDEAIYSLPSLVRDSDASATRAGALSPVQSTNVAVREY